MFHFSKMRRCLSQNEKLKRKIHELKNSRDGSIDVDTVQKIVGQDQFALMTAKVQRIGKWSNESILEGLRTRFSCGRTAYEEERKKRRLPSSRTLSERLQGLKFGAGCLHEVFEFMEYKVKDMNNLDMDCAIVFDEMAIQKGVNYCSNLKQFVGNITLPNHCGIATHVMVFMLVGIRARWKQVIAYHFTGDTVDHGCLKSIVVDLIQKAENIGLRVHALISDCGSK